MSNLALLGGSPAVTKDPSWLIKKWPIITQEDEDAVLEVLRRGAMSGTDVSIAFENDFKKWIGMDYALGYSSGTASLQGAMYGVGLMRGDELICPTVTYWASCTQAYSLGATVVFANVDPETLCIDPADIERCISPKTKAIIAVHYLGHPADMDAIMAIAKKHNIKVIEDVSHAQGALYKGKVVGTIGDVAAMSLMSGKSFAIGEAGMLVTNNREIYERAMSIGHYERFQSDAIETPYLKPLTGLPLGGYKYRMHQLSSAVGRVQIKYYDERCVEIRRAMNYFWDQLEGTPGIRAHRVDESKGYTMGGWYAASGLYRPEELGGLSVTRFCDALRAEGVPTSPGCNAALHTHAIFNDADIYNDGKPTRIASASRDVRELDSALAASEQIGAHVYSVPWFKHYDKEAIDEYVTAFKKVCANYKELLKDDAGNPAHIGGWHFFTHTTKKA